jgi:hypothetical protein
MSDAKKAAVYIPVGIAMCAMGIYYPIEWPAKWLVMPILIGVGATLAGTGWGKAKKQSS